MAVDLEHLVTFRTVALLGNLTAAAKRLELSQPTVSRHVQAIEREMDGVVFERVPRGVILTPAGRAVLSAAGDILGRLRDLRDALAAERSGRAGTLSIGASVTACLYVLPSLLEQMRRRHPGIELHVVNCRAHEVLSQVREGRVDVGFSSARPPMPDIDFWPYLELELGLLRLGKPSRRRVDPKELAFTSFVLPTQGLVRETIGAMFAHAGIAPPCRAEADSLEVVKRLVLDGYGVGVVPLISCTDADRDAGLTVQRFKGPTPALQVGALTRRGAYLVRPLRDFLALVEEGRSRGQPAKRRRKVKKTAPAARNRRKCTGPDFPDSRLA